MLLAYFSLLFTGYVSSGMMRFNLGYIEMALILLFIAYKVLYIMFFTLKSLYFNTMKCYAKIKHPELRKAQTEDETNCPSTNSVRSMRTSITSQRDSVTRMMIQNE